MHHRPTRPSGLPRLLAVAHGTRSTTGRAAIARLVSAIAAARPGVVVELCYLDVAEPRLASALGDDRGPTVAVPLLLSTGYHVQSDIPAAVAGRADVCVARHLGPHPLLVDALLDRLPPAAPGTPTLLIGAGSSRPEARAELDATAAELAARIEGSVQVVTMSDDLPALFRARPGPLRIATYLLADGQFVTTVRDAASADGRTDVTVADPLGGHPALVELVWSRYDEARDRVR